MNAMDRLDLSDVKFACAVYYAVFVNPDFRDICVAGVFKVVAALDEREQRILDKRLRQGLTLEAIGADLGLSRERIRQIEAHAIRKLRIPKTAANMKASKMERRIADLLAQVEALTERNEALAGQDSALRRSIKAALSGAVNTEPPPTMPIDELDLSVRAYNCLTRAGYRTTEDVLALDRVTLLRIRNLGRGTLSVIVSRMRQAGFIEWAQEVLLDA